LVLQLDAAGLERIRDVFQKQQPKDDVLVFRGIDGAAKFVSRLPEFVGEIEVAPDGRGECLLLQRDNSLRSKKDWTPEYQGSDHLARRIPVLFPQLAQIVERYVEE